MGYSHAVFNLFLSRPHVFLCLKACQDHYMLLMVDLLIVTQMCDIKRLISELYKYRYLSTYICIIQHTCNKQGSNTHCFGLRINI